MGLIREPKGVDFIVGPSVLTSNDKKMISEIIADYKMNGKIPSKGTSKYFLNEETSHTKEASSRKHRSLAH